MLFESLINWEFGLWYLGMAQFVSNFSEPGDPEYSPPVLKGETPVSLFLWFPHFLL